MGKKIGKVGAIVIIFIMLGSTVAYSIIQGIGSVVEEEEIEIPDSKIIEGELKVYQESYLREQGKTIIKFYYNLQCDDCFADMGKLEALTETEGFSDQIIVEEIITNEGKVPRLLIMSIKGQKELTDYTDDDIVDSLCKLMRDPPVGCVLRNI